MKPKKLHVISEFFRKEIEESAPDCLSEDIYEARSALIRYLNASMEALEKIGCHYPQPLERLTTALMDLQMGVKVDLFEPIPVSNRPPKGSEYQMTMGYACALIYAKNREHKDVTIKDAAYSVAKYLKKLSLPLPEQTKSEQSDGQRLLKVYYKVQSGEAHKVAVGLFKAVRDMGERPLMLQIEFWRGGVEAAMGYYEEFAEFLPTRPARYLVDLLDAENMAHFTKKKNAKAKALLQKYIDLGPDSERSERDACLYVLLTRCHIQDLDRGWGQSRAESIERMRAAAFKAVELDGTNAEAQLQLGIVYSFEGDAAAALSATRRAIELGPKNADVLANAGWILSYVSDQGNAGEAVALIEQAIRLNQVIGKRKSPGWYAFALGFALYFDNRFEDSIATLQLFRPGPFQVRLYLAANYGQLGRSKEAAEIAESLLREKPLFSAREYAETIGIINKEPLAHFLDGMRKAGMPD